MKLTDWFPGDVKPVHAGVYQRKYGTGSPMYCFWTGYRWMYGALSREDAVKETWDSTQQELPWRGIER